MSAHHSCFELMRRWEGDEESRLLFADLVETADWQSYLPGKRAVPEPWPDGITFRLRGEGVEDMPHASFGWVLVSERIKLLIEAAQLSGISFYPVRVESALPFSLPRYWYGHLTLLDDAIDLERAMYWNKKPEGSDRELFFLVKAAFKRSAIEGWDFFRAAESTPSMFCSARFHDLALKHRCTGIDFLPVPVS